MSRTFQLTSAGSSILSDNFYPPIELDVNKRYGLGLIGFYTYHSIKNVTNRNNVIPFQIEQDDGRTSIVDIVIPPGAYELEDINKYIQRALWKKVHPNDKLQKEEDLNDLFHLVANNNTLKCEITSKYAIRFDSTLNSIAGLLGFNDTMYMTADTIESPNPVSINNYNLLRLDCNIVGDSYINGKSAHSLYYFDIDVEPGFKIVKEPHNIIYLPITPIGRQYIDNITICVVNENGDLIDFGQEIINIIVELKILD